MKPLHPLEATILSTRFAEPFRLPRESIAQQYLELMKSPNIEAVLNAVPFMTVILNRFRQVLFCNHAFMEMLQISDIEDVLGMRPGEVMNCVHSDSEPFGCGTAEECRVCGAVNAVLQSIETGILVKHEARIQVKSAVGTVTSLDLAVSANPFLFEGNLYAIVTIADTSDEKRRKVLERIFLHDLANVAGGIVGISELLQTKPPSETLDELKALNTASRQLFDELRAQQQLLRAENSEITIKEEQIGTLEIIEDVVDMFSKSYLLSPCEIVIAPQSCSVIILCDRTILFRVLSNMLKNAIEASASHNMVTAGVDTDGENVLFHIHNTAFIPYEVQLQIFQRSFSTRGTGRGLGTYSIKLLTERYLNGKVYFESTKMDGTTFYLSVPQKNSAGISGEMESTFNTEESLRESGNISKRTALEVAS